MEEFYIIGIGFKIFGVGESGSKSASPFFHILPISICLKIEYLKYLLRATKIYPPGGAVANIRLVPRMIYLRWPG